MALLADGVPLEVPIWLRSRAEKPKWVSGITSATTCGDVLGCELISRVCRIWVKLTKFGRIS